MRITRESENRCRVFETIYWSVELIRLGKNKFEALISMQTFIVRDYCPYLANAEAETPLKAFREAREKLLENFGYGDESFSRKDHARLKTLIEDNERLRLEFEEEELEAERKYSQ